MFFPHLPNSPFSKMNVIRVSAAHEAAAKSSYFRAIKSTRIKEGRGKSSTITFLSGCLFSCKSALKI